MSKYLDCQAGVFTQLAALTETSGSADAGKIVATNSGGFVDRSMRASGLAAGAIQAGAGSGATGYVAGPDGGAATDESGMIFISTTDSSSQSAPELFRVDFEFPFDIAPVVLISAYQQGAASLMSFLYPVVDTDGFYVNTESNADIPDSTIFQINYLVKIVRPAPTPIISSVSSNPATVGVDFTITGENFQNTTSVYIRSGITNYLADAFTIDSRTQITARFDTARSGTLRVLNVQGNFGAYTGFSVA